MHYVIVANSYMFHTFRDGVFQALKGRNIITEGEALCYELQVILKALKGRNTFEVITPLQGLT